MHKNYDNKINNNNNTKGEEKKGGKLKKLPDQVLYYLYKSRMGNFIY